MATPPTNITEDEVFDEYVIEDENENQDEDEDENEGEGEDEEYIEIIKNSVELPSSQYELDSILSSCQKTTNIRVVDDELTNLLKDWGHLEVLDHFKISEEDAEQTYRALKYDNLSCEEFERSWKACINHRLLEIKNASSTSEILNKWPQYKLPSGHRFVDIDYSYLYPNAGSFLNNWETLGEKLLKFLSTDNRVKEKNIREVLIKIKTADSSENCKDAALLWALHGYFVPFQKVIKKDIDGRKHVIRHTIKDSQNSFVWIGNTIQAIEDHIAFLNKMGENIQPFIIVHGVSILNFSEIFLYFDGVKFPFNSFIRAVDICYKIFYLFNLEYPTACSSFWGFIETQYHQGNKKKLCGKTHVLLNEIS
ncbi:uncharacterized protein LOC129915128 [Episyrphus balteatus]|uniref:uncharacterized protein LOC129915128 n=1 Tax=Episyrphus balteatus TaxID=286459 RepID=UPI0024861190|nr:uncharacterized protein LOC129915128 [Episyrphus balteatus]